MFFFDYRSRLHRIAVHLLFWIAYISFFSALGAINSRLSFGAIWFRTLLFVPVDLIATYITMYVLIPKLFLLRKYLWFTISFALLGFATIFLNQTIRYFVYIPLFAAHIPKGNFFHFDWYVYLVSTYTVVTLAAGIKIAKLWLKQKKDIAELQAARAHSEIALLKYQINPHFIFNTLNNIDTLIHKDPDKASACIMKLSSIMRYVTYESENDKVPLDQEIIYLKSFIDLQQLRFGKEIITFDISVEEPGKPLAPMLLIPLVENAIKHGSKVPGTPAIQVKLHANEHFEFTVSNAINTDLINKDKTGGIGLKNLKRRLELIYPDSFLLECHTDFEQKQYFTRLWIK